MSLPYRFLFFIIECLGKRESCWKPWWPWCSNGILAFGWLSTRIRCFHTMRLNFTTLLPPNSPSPTLEKKLPFTSSSTTIHKMNDTTVIDTDDTKQETTKRKGTTSPKHDAQKNLPHTLRIPPAILDASPPPTTHGTPPPPPEPLIKQTITLRFGNTPTP